MQNTSVMKATTWWVSSLESVRRQDGQMRLQSANVSVTIIKPHYNNNGCLMGQRSREIHMAAYNTIVDA